MRILSNSLLYNIALEFLVRALTEKNKISDIWTSKVLSTTISINRWHKLTYREIYKKPKIVLETI